MTQPPTKDELFALIADSANDTQSWDHELKPPWIADRSDDPWRHIRERERKIVRLTHRLDKAKRQLDRDFDLST